MNKKVVSLADLEEKLDQIKEDLNIAIEPEYLRELLIKSIYSHLFKPIEPLLEQLTLKQKVDLVTEFDQCRRKHIPYDSHHH